MIVIGRILRSMHQMPLAIGKVICGLLVKSIDIKIYGRDGNAHFQELSFIIKIIQ